MSDNDYDVGYGKPPPQHQFQKGRSGNPRGRPRKDKNPRIHNADDLRHCWLHEVNRPIKIVQDGKELTLPAIAAIHRQLVMKALKGDPRAIREVLKQTQPHYEKEDTIRLQYMQMIADAEEEREAKYKKMTPYQREMERYKYYSGRRAWRKIMGKPESKPFEPDEPQDERDWQAYEQYLDDLEAGRPAQWPPKYWDDEVPDPGSA